MPVVTLELRADFQRFQGFQVAQVRGGTTPGASSLLTGCPIVPMANIDPIDRDDTGPTPDDSFQPEPWAHDSEAASEAARPAGRRTIDDEVTRLLRLLGIYECTTNTSVALAICARSGSKEAFEAMLAMLEEVQPLWNDLVAHHRTRYTSTLLDELSWWIKHRHCRQGTPEQVARYMGLVSVLELGAELAKRLRM